MVESLKCVADRDVSLHKASHLVVVYPSSWFLFIHATSWLAKISPVYRCRELHLHIPAPLATRGTMSTRPVCNPGTLIIVSAGTDAPPPPLPLRYLVMGQYVCRILLRCKKLPISTARHLRFHNPSLMQNATFSQLSMHRVTCH